MTKPTDTTPLTLRVSTKQADALRAFAARTDTTMGVVVDAALDAYLAEHRDEGDDEAG